MPQAATIKSLPRAFRMMKAMQAHGIEWGDDYRQSAAAALTDMLHGRMASTIDRHLEDMDRLDQADRRNGTYPRWLMTELGEIALSVPRTRRFSALTVVRAFARRAPHIDRMILACFVLGLSTRKVAIALAPVLGRRISAATVSQVAKTLDVAVAAFHRRRLKDIYPVLMLDGLPAQRPRRAARLLALQDHRGAQGRAHHKRHRAPLPRGRTRPMGVFQDRTSMDRILFAVFTHENSTQGVLTLFSLTQTF